MTQGSFTDWQVHQWLAEVAEHPYVSLHYDAPVLGAINSNEISGSGYLRSLITFSEPANRTIWSLTDATFSGLQQCQLTHFGIWDAQTGGQLRAQARLPFTVTILNGRGFIMKSGEIAISLA